MFITHKIGGNSETINLVDCPARFLDRGQIFLGRQCLLIATNNRISRKQLSLVANLKDSCIEICQLGSNNSFVRNSGCTEAFPIGKGNKTTVKDGDEFYLIDTDEELKFSVHILSTTPESPPTKRTRDLSPLSTSSGNIPSKKSKTKISNNGDELYERFESKATRIFLSHNLNGSPGSIDLMDCPEKFLDQGLIYFGRINLSIGNTRVSKKQLSLVADLKSLSLEICQMGQNNSFVKLASQHLPLPLGRGEKKVLVDGDEFYLLDMDEKLKFTVHITDDSPASGLSGLDQHLKYTNPTPNPTPTPTPNPTPLISHVKDHLMEKLKPISKPKFQKIYLSHNFGGPCEIDLLNCPDEFKDQDSIYLGRESLRIKDHHRISRKQLRLEVDTRNQIIKLGANNSYFKLLGQKTALPIGKGNQITLHDGDSIFLIDTDDSMKFVAHFENEVPSPYSSSSSKDTHFSSTGLNPPSTSSRKIHSSSKLVISKSANSIIPKSIKKKRHDSGSDTDDFDRSFINDNSESEISDLTDEEDFIKSAKSTRKCDRSQVRRPDPHSSEDDKDNRVVCKYGTKCYRKNQDHFAEFSHPWLDKDKAAATFVRDHKEAERRHEQKELQRQMLEQDVKELHEKGKREKEKMQEQRQKEEKIEKEKMQEQRQKEEKHESETKTKLLEQQEKNQHEQIVKKKEPHLSSHQEILNETQKISFTAPKHPAFVSQFLDFGDDNTTMDLDLSVSLFPDSYDEAPPQISTVKLKDYDVTNKSPVIFSDSPLKTHAPSSRLKEKEVINLPSYALFPDSDGTTPLIDAEKPRESVGSPKRLISDLEVDFDSQTPVRILFLPLIGTHENGIQIKDSLAGLFEALSKIEENQWQSGDRIVLLDNRKDIQDCLESFDDISEKVLFVHGDFIISLEDFMRSETSRKTGVCVVEMTWRLKPESHILTYSIFDKKIGMITAKEIKQTYENGNIGDVFSGDYHLLFSLNSSNEFQKEFGISKVLAVVSPNINPKLPDRIDPTDSLTLSKKVTLTYTNILTKFLMTSVTIGPKNAITPKSVKPVVDA
ncbi:hypothetical protein HK096_006376, partial [Nowakowskiella sp. JEL0078]